MREVNGFWVAAVGVGVGVFAAWRRGDFPRFATGLEHVRRVIGYPVMACWVEGAGSEVELYCIVLKALKFLRAVVGYGWL